MKDEIEQEKGLYTKSRKKFNERGVPRFRKDLGLMISENN